MTAYTQRMELPDHPVSQSHLLPSDTQYTTEEHTARFTDEGYVIANQRGEQSFDYSSVQALCEDGRYFFLMLSRQQGNLFDKQGFHTGTADQFRAFLERKTGQTMKKL